MLSLLYTTTQMQRWQYEYKQMSLLVICWLFYLFHSLLLPMLLLIIIAEEEIFWIGFSIPTHKLQSNQFTGYK